MAGGGASCFSGSVVARRTSGTIHRPEHAPIGAEGAGAVTSGGADHRQRRWRNQAGFTLVEALVAITLLSLLSIALTGGLRFGIDAWARGSAHSDQLSRTLAVQGLLHDVIGQAYPYFLSRDPSQPNVD